MLSNSYFSEIPPLERQDSWSSDLVILGSHSEFDFVTTMTASPTRSTKSGDSKAPGSLGLFPRTTPSSSHRARFSLMAGDLENEECDDNEEEEEESDDLFVDSHGFPRHFNNDKFDFGRLMTVMDDDDDVDSNRFSTLARMRFRHSSSLMDEEDEEDDDEEEDESITLSIAAGGSHTSRSGSYYSAKQQQSFSANDLGTPLAPRSLSPPSQAGCDPSTTTTTFQSKAAALVSPVSEAGSFPLKDDEKPQLCASSTSEETVPVDEDMDRLFGPYTAMIDNERTSIDHIKELLQNDTKVSDREAAAFLYGIKFRLQQRVDSETTIKTEGDKEVEMKEEGDTPSAPSPLSTSLPKPEEEEEEKKEEEKEEEDTSKPPSPKNEPNKESIPGISPSSSQESTSRYETPHLNKLRSRASRKSTLFDQKLSMMMSMMKENPSTARAIDNDDCRTAVSVMSTLSCRDLSIQRLQRRIASRIRRSEAPEDDASRPSSSSREDKDKETNNDMGKDDDSNNRNNTMKRVQQLLGELQDAQSRQRRLEQQLSKAGITIAEDIPYAVAKERVTQIANRMQAIGTSQATHPDPETQKKLRQEYFVLEQQMEKYTRALELTDEFILEQEKIEQAWDEEQSPINALALKHVLQHMPVQIRQHSIETWLQTRTPSGHYLPKEFLLKFSRTNVLTLLRMDPELLCRAHPCNLESRRVTGLTLTERRALQAYLQPMATKHWKTRKDSLTQRKWNWYCTMRQNLKEYQRAYQQHESKYNFSDKDGCSCTMGRRCPIQANQKFNYFAQDYGYPCDTNNPQYEKQQDVVPSTDVTAKSSSHVTPRESAKVEKSSAIKQKLNERTPKRLSLMEEIAAKAGGKESKNGKNAESKQQTSSTPKRSSLMEEMVAKAPKRLSLMEEIAAKARKRNSNTALAEFASRGNAKNT